MYHNDMLRWRRITTRGKRKQPADGGAQPTGAVKAAEMEQERWRF